jgi:hypothetical protein
MEMNIRIFGLSITIERTGCAKTRKLVDELICARRYITAVATYKNGAEKSLVEARDYVVERSAKLGVPWIRGGC